MSKGEAGMCLKEVRWQHARLNKHRIMVCITREAQRTKQRSNDGCFQLSHCFTFDLYERDSVSEFGYYDSLHKALNDREGGRVIKRDESRNVLRSSIGGFKDMIDMMKEGEFGIKCNP